jgi:hypothetical protein
MRDYSENVRDLFANQLTEWDLARDNYRQLDDVQIRNISYDGFDVSVQFNPGRIISSAARVDTRSIEERPCFLCKDNRPVRQLGINFQTDYIILINPFPIFRRHLTIASLTHTEQRIKHNFTSMLDLSEALPEFVVFYNGPQCGASAPDHLHFQAGNRGFLPLETDFGNNILCSRVAGKKGMELWLWKGYRRGILTLRGTDSDAISSAFSRFFDVFMVTQPDRPEPMLNIITYHSDGEWIIHIIPRKLHRPSQFFADGKDKILLSPASVDIGGVFITPREEDYRRLTRETINDILMQVCLDDEEIASLTKDII